MRGDIDNTHLVSLDGSPSAKSRVVYSLRRVPEQRIQFGTVTVDYGTVAVWRPFDPDDTGHDAAWRSMPWRNVYRVHVPQLPISGRPGYIGYEVTETQVGEVRARLPVAELALSHHLEQHLAKI